MKARNVVFEEKQGLRNAAAIIIIKLTASCLVAASLMGVTFLITFDAKRRNEHRDFQRTVYELLGYNKNNPAPSDLKLHVIYRYVISKADAANVGYMLPVERDKKEKYEFLVIDSKGRLVEHPSLDISPVQASQSSAREGALKDLLGPSSSFIYVDSTLVATRDKKRIAYLLRREFPGFKSLIRVMVALDPSFQIIGLEILEDEEESGAVGLKYVFFQLSAYVEPYNSQRYKAYRLQVTDVQGGNDMDQRSPHHDPHHSDGYIADHLWYAEAGKYTPTHRSQNNGNSNEKYELLHDFPLI